MGKRKIYSQEFKLQMVHLLAKGTHNMSQVSRDYHVTRSLLYAWIRLYQERGEAAFASDRAIDAPPEVERPANAEERAAHLERLCGQQALELDLLRSEVDLLKKPGISSRPTTTCHDRAATGTGAYGVDPPVVCAAQHQPAMVLPASPPFSARGP